MPKTASKGPVQVQTAFRFAPHVIVFPLVIVLALPVLRRALVSWNYWWYGPSYAQVTLVMDEFRPNSGSPYITGHFEGETEPRGLVGLERDGRQLVKAMPTLEFAPGAPVKVWYSPKAPNTVYFGEEANVVPVQVHPELPGGGAFAGWFFAELGVLYVAMWLTTWVYRRFYYESGTLPVRRSGSTVNMPTQLHNVRAMAEEYTDAWCSHDPDAVASFYAKDGSLAINGGQPAIGRPAIAAAAQSFMTAFPDLQVALDNVVQRGDRFVYSWTLTGVNSGPGGMGYPVKISGTETWRLNDDGDIVESQGRYDQADYDRQVRLGPAART
jgi:uncharacterized protein (TIGR02246 family)